MYDSYYFLFGALYYGALYGAHHTYGSHHTYGVILRVILALYV